MPVNNISQEELNEITDILNVLLTKVAGRPVCYALLVGPTDPLSENETRHTTQMMSNTSHDILPSWLREAANKVEGKS